MIISRATARLGPRVFYYNSARMICEWSISDFTIVHLLKITCHFEKFLTIMKSVIDHSDSTATKAPAGQYLLAESVESPLKCVVLSVLGRGEGGVM